MDVFGFVFDQQPPARRVSLLLDSNHFADWDQMHWAVARDQFDDDVEELHGRKEMLSERCKRVLVGGHLKVYTCWEMESEGDESWRQLLCSRRNKIQAGAIPRNVKRAL